ncbi:MAG: hypothetical protein ACLFV7_01580 [Phycisphaerae bacterium]
MNDSQTTRNRRRLFELLDAAQSAGKRFRPLRDLPAALERQALPVFLKHDVHGVDLASLEHFAGEERDRDIFGTFFFLPPGHPQVGGRWQPDQWVATMQRLEQMGHEVGLHLDGFDLIARTGRPLRDAVGEIVQPLRDAGLTLSCANTHGNTATPTRDRDGYGVMFDLVEETARQPDYPRLANVPPELAETIRTHRCSAADLGFTHFGDLPLWTRTHGLVVTNYLSDNNVGRRGTAMIVVHPQTDQGYKLVDHQPPGSKRSLAAREIIAPREPMPAPAPQVGERHVPFHGPAMDAEWARLITRPCLMLLHPQYYLDA